MRELELPPDAEATAAGVDSAIHHTQPLPSPPILTPTLTLPTPSSPPPQDLDFEIASSRMRLSKDGKFLAATGVYPPQVAGPQRRHTGT